jgi:aspartate carbamoyltransferase regulatory subunit
VIAGDIRLVPISNGTAIDHLKPFTGLKILQVLGHNYDSATTIAVNTESDRLGKKDLIFIENKLLEEKDLEKIAVIAQGATVNIVRDQKVMEKSIISLPKKVVGILQCMNPKCITRIEPMQTTFSISENPVQAHCYYCEKSMNEKEILDNV